MTGFIPLLFLATGLIVEPPQSATAPRYMVKLFTEVASGTHAPGPSTAEVRELADGKRLTMHPYASGKQCGFSSGFREIPPSAAVAWTVEVTPVTMAADHVRLLIRWSRVVLRGQRTQDEPQESTILFRPGDVLQLDALRLPDTPCLGMVGALALELQAFEPIRTLTSTDLWLVHRLPNGKEETEHLEVRSKFNAPTKFFFDGVRLGTNVIDVFGELKLRARPTGKIGLELNAQRFLLVEGPGRMDGFPDVIAGYFGYGTPDVKVDVGQEDVTSFEIPLGTGPEWQTFAGHSLSLRVKSRRIR